MSLKIEKKPIPEDVSYVNDLGLATSLLPYEHAKALTGKTKKEGGILPDDNFRIYVPLDLNSEVIMHELYTLFSTLGFVSESNEFSYSLGTDRVLRLLEIYDQAWVEKEKIGNKAMKAHSEHGKVLAEEIVEYLLENEGCAECFPYDEVEELKKEYSL